MNHIKLLFKHLRTVKALDFILIAVLVTLICVLTYLFYFFPSNDKTSATTTVNSNSETKPSDEGSTDTSNGIGGGNIIGNCKVGKKNLPIYCVDAKCDDEQKKYAALSFDAAWGDEDTIKILDILDKYNVKVTFFMTGGWVDSFPDMVKEILSRGHDLGNHSQSHKQMSKLDVSAQKNEILSVGRTVKELTGYDMFLFRPPYGDYNSTLITTAYSLNYYPIQWSVDSLDWKDYGVENIIKTVTQHKALDNGAIILMHNGAKFTSDALETVITTLQNQGYTLVPISKLIIRENFHMDGTGKQISN